MSTAENTSTTDKKPFALPKWKKIKGDEHTISNYDIGFDLCALEEFLNNMIALGWQPVRISSFSNITFVPCAPGAFICRTTVTATKWGTFNKAKAAEVGELLAAEGAVIVPQLYPFGSQMGLVALRPAELGAFEVNTNLDSSIAEYEARIKTSSGLAAAFYAIAAITIATGIIGDNIGISCAAPVWIAIGIYYHRPVSRYKKIVAQLKSQREVLET